MSSLFTQSPVPKAAPFVKVCGLTSLADAEAAAGADWVGLNFHPASPRQVTIERASEIVAALPATTEAVGLFVDRSVAEVIDVASRVGLTIIQLHGDEPASDVRSLHECGLRVVRAFRLADAEAWARMVSWLARAGDLDATPDAVLVDAHVPGLAGGTGQTIAVGVLDLLAANPVFPRLILAGGLGPANVAGCVARVRPWMVDVASGVESAPGRKDPAKVAAFLQAVRAASPSTDDCP